MDILLLIGIIALLCLVSSIFYLMKYLPYASDLRALQKEIKAMRTVTNRQHEQLEELITKVKTLEDRQPPCYLEIKRENEVHLAKLDNVFNRGIDNWQKRIYTDSDPDDSM